MIEFTEEQQRWIDSHYLLLPTDADGVPIRVGETVYGKYVMGNPEYAVSGFEFDMAHGIWNIKIGAASWASQGLLSHVKPDPLKELLVAMGEEIWNAANDPHLGGTWNDCGLHGIEERYAERIREILGVRR